METFIKKDPKLLDKIRRRKMNDFTKIRKGSVYNAYTRKNLGSIPSKFDNFIFKLPEESKSNLSSVIQPMMAQDENLCFRKDIFKNEHKSWSNFGSGNSIELKGNTVKFMVNNVLREGKRMSEFDPNNIDSFKTIYSNTNNSTNNTFYNNNNNIFSKEVNQENLSSDKIDLNEKTKNISSMLNLETKNNYKSKSLTNIFAKEDRYYNVHYQRQLLSKYYPGPGEYEQNTIKDYYNPNNFQFRYNSLFKLKSSFPLIEHKVTTYNVGPGSYLRSTFKPNSILGKFSKARKSMGDIKQSKEEDNTYNDRDKEYPELPGGISIHDRDRMNYFFIKKKNKEEKLEKKCGIIEDDLKKKMNNMNVYGEFEIKPRWGSKEKTKDFNNDWVNQSLEKKILEEKKKGNIIDIHGNMHETDLIEENKVKQDIIYWARLAEEEIKKGKEDAKKKKCAYTFSKIPKLVRENKHVPGPGYYEPDRILKAIKQKKIFNYNMENNWI